MHPRKLSAALVVLSALVWASPALAQDDSSSISLGVGIQKVINVPGIARIAIGDPAIADVKPLGSSQVLVVGMAEGKTTLLIWKTNGSRLSYYISVTKKGTDEIIEEIKKLLGEREGIFVRKVGDRIYLDGYAYTTEDHDRVEQIVTLYPNLVKSFVKVAPNAKKLVANNLNAALQRAGLKNVQANVVGTTIFLEGSVESQQDLQKAEMITKAIGEKVESLLVVGIKRMILTEVQFVEIRRSNTDTIGIKWPLNLTSQASGASVNFAKGLAPSSPFRADMTGNLAVGTDFSFNVQFSDGYGRLLAQPKLVCASGEKAEFLAGGQVPIPLITLNVASIEYKDYGIKLAIRPTADRHGNIQTEIEAESSEVDRSVSVTIGSSINIPGFRTRKVKTNVTVRHGETIVMSGIFEHQEQKDISKIPLLGHIPIIGELFKSRDLTGTKRELVIFVTPRIVNPDTERIRKLIDDIKARYKQARDEVGYNIFD
jgi:pilus assembly protein CpaC